MSSFKREDDRTYNMSQQFIDGLLLNCPFCKTHEPKWVVKHETRIIDNYSYFKCNKCGAVIRVKDSDITGEATIKYNIKGLIKLMDKKDLKVIYAKVMDVGNIYPSDDFLDSEINIKKLYNMQEEVMA